MMSVLIFFTIIVLIILLFTSLTSMLSIKMKIDCEKLSVFECGFDILSVLRLPFSLNFYFIIIIFLIFDVELVLILPFIFNMKLLSIMTILILMSLFFIVLILGFIYEWLAGLLNWLI